MSVHSAGSKGELHSQATPPVPSARYPAVTVVIFKDVSLIKGADHYKKSKKSIFSFSHFLKNVRFKNALSKFYEEIRKIDGDIVFSVKRCQVRERAARNFERVFLRMTFFNRVDSLQRKLYVQLT